MEVFMIYLDNAATGGTKPYSVQNAVLASLKACANPGRSGHALSLACAERVQACRVLLDDVFNGYGFDRVVFTKNCTEALNLALIGTLCDGDHVVTTCLEHNSVLRPLDALARAGTITYDVVPLRDGQIFAEDVLARVKENTAVVAVTSASNVTGYAPDLAAIRSILPPRVKLVVDGAQGAGHFPLKMRELGIDALALAGHKGLNAIQGAGALLFSDRVTPRPLLFGGTGSESISLAMPEYFPDRLESGTLSYPAICSLFEGVLQFQADEEAGGKKLLSLTTRVYEALSDLSNYRAFFRPNASGICAFAHKEIPSEEVASILSERFHIAVRGGLHCAPLAHKALGTDNTGLVRASFSPVQSWREADALLRALKRI